MDVRAVLADVAGLGPYFAVGAGPVDPGPDETVADEAGGGWRPMAELLADRQPLRARIAQVRRALDSDERVAASIAFQGLAAQLLSAPFAAVVVHRVLPRLTSRALLGRPTGTGMWSLACPDPAGDAAAEVAAGAAGLAALLLDDQLPLLVAAVRAEVSLAERLLWGNAASALAGAKRVLGSARPEVAGRAAELAERLLATGPLAGTGELRPPHGPDRVWSFRRRSCCLYYRVAGAGLCEDCALVR